MTQQADFVSGRELSRQLSAIIEPRFRELYPGVPVALALLGPGSDVLGYDTARSMDHDWGPRLSIVVHEDDRERISSAITRDIDAILPSDVAGHSTRFSRHDDGTLCPDETGELHRIDITSVESLLQSTALISNVEAMTVPVWLSTPMQSLLELTSGAVFVDDAGDLTRMQEVLAFYPDDVWRYQLAGLWMRIGQIQPFIGRTAEVGDNIGSASIAANIIRDFMRIALLQSRQYAPYSKWLGTAFGRTSIGNEIGANLDRALTATNWQDRAREINVAGEVLIQQFNQLQLVPTVAEKAQQFYSRPYQVLPAEEIAYALRASLVDSGLARLDATLGGIDVITDSTDALGSHEFRRAYHDMIQCYLR